MSFSSIGLALQILISLFGAFFLAFWIGLIVWTFRDIRSRSRDIFAQLLATLMVIMFNVPGLILYFLLRPQDTLAEKYERALEEEALLQDIEERYSCPGCKQKIRADFQFCPSCHTQLKQGCPSCGKLLQLQWDLCPYCGATPDPKTPAFKPVRPSKTASRGAAQPVTQRIQVPKTEVERDTVRLTEVSSADVSVMPNSLESQPVKPPEDFLFDDTATAFGEETGEEDYNESDTSQIVS